MDSGRLPREKCAELIASALAPVELDQAGAAQLVDAFTRSWAS